MRCGVVSRSFPAHLSFLLASVHRFVAHGEIPRSSSAIAQRQCVAWVSKHLPHCTEVDLSNCKGLTDADVLKLAAGCPNIERLGAGWVSRLSDESIRALVEGCQLVHKFFLCGCAGLHDDSLRILASAPKLSKLYLNSCSNITDEGLVALASDRNCRHVSTLYISSCQHVTDVGLCSLASSRQIQQSLKILSITGLHISDRSLLGLTKCTQLTKLQLGPLSDFLTVAGIQALMAAVPNCDIHIQNHSSSL